MKRHDQDMDNSSPRIREAIGESETFIAFQEQLSKVAKVDRPVLIMGERGSGKELAAARLHYLSQRWQEPLVALNCAALSSSLIESELFGYEAGAFTGADHRRAGRFETADGGTLFLDEIGNLPLEVQAKILRVVEYQSFERVGSSYPTQVDVRIIGATNVDLPNLADEGRFKRDLLDRLSFEVLFIPPLRERRGDITLLAQTFAARMAHELGRSEVPVFSEDVLRALENHTWPGNVRELKNVIERAVYKTDTVLVDQVVFDPFRRNFQFPAQRDEKTDLSTVMETHDQGEHSLTRASRTDPSLDIPLSEQVSHLEKQLLIKALDASSFNQKEAANVLGLSYYRFRNLYRKHGFI
jgi:psp operon transcriptional activator